MRALHRDCRLGMDMTSLILHLQVGFCWAPPVVHQYPRAQSINEKIYLFPAQVNVAHLWDENGNENL